MAHLVNFGLSQEDERTEVAALEPGPGDRVLSIASAGDMPLSLLAHGVARVDAVDIDAAQLHLLRLKAAAVEALEREQAMRFLGFLPAAGDERGVWLRAVLSCMPEASRAFWSAEERAVRAGAIWAGRYERYVRTLARLAIPFVGRRRVEGLFACTSLQEQRCYFDTHFERSRYRALFRLAFHPKVFSSRGMDPRSLRHRDSRLSLGDAYFEQFRALCTGTLARDNHLLQITLLGRVLSPDVAPHYLSAEGFEAARRALDRLRVRHVGLVEHLRSVPDRSIDKAHLSNFGDWLSQEAFDEVVRLVAAKMSSSGRLVWRYIHVDRAVPSEVAHRVRTDRALGDRLRAEDRFPFYAIVPARIEGQEGSA
jgi:S-adenosylmethionine-diacylglycerol 3-amino-3-carboxypropyl transferase